MEIEEVYDHTDETARKFEEVLRLTQRTALFEIERRAKQKAPVDTGFLKNSIFTKISGTIYVNGKAGDQPSAPPLLRYSKRAKKEVKRAAVQFASTGSKSEGQGEVAVGAEYAIYQEMGIGEEGARAQPFLVPAFDEVVREVPDLMNDLLKEAGLI